MNKKQKMAEFFNDVYKVSVTGRGVQVTESMKDYALEKLGKIDKFTDKIISVHVIMEIQKLDHKCDIVMNVDHVKIKAQANSTDMYASIDEAIKKLEAQLRRYLDKRHDHHAIAREERKMSIDVISPFTEEDQLDGINDKILNEKDREFEKAYRPHAVVKQKTKPLKLLTVEEAILKMDLSLDNFLVFRNEKSRKLQVIYRRDDGNYGIMNTEE
jgi:putative sigma-54 modulation protein